MLKIFIHSRNGFSLVSTAISMSMIMTGLLGLVESIDMHLKAAGRSIASDSRMFERSEFKMHLSGDLCKSAFLGYGFNPIPNSQVELTNFSAAGLTGAASIRSLGSVFSTDPNQFLSELNFGQFFTNPFKLLIEINLSFPLSSEPPVFEILDCAVLADNTTVEALQAADVVGIPEEVEAPIPTPLPAEITCGDRYAIVGFDSEGSPICREMEMPPRVCKCCLYEWGTPDMARIATSVPIVVDPNRPPLYVRTHYCRWQDDAKEYFNNQIIWNYNNEIGPEGEACQTNISATAYHYAGVITGIYSRDCEYVSEVSQ